MEGFEGSGAAVAVAEAVAAAKGGRKEKDETTKLRQVENVTTSFIIRKEFQNCKIFETSVHIYLYTY